MMVCTVYKSDAFPVLMGQIKGFFTKSMSTMMTSSPLPAFAMTSPHGLTTLK
jgi:hypothetical protein